jgi:hypothetical protein
VPTCWLSSIGGAPELIQHTVRLTCGTDRHQGASFEFFMETLNPSLKLGTLMPVCATCQQPHCVLYEFWRTTNT